MPEESTPEAPAQAVTSGLDDKWRHVLGLPCQLTVDIPLPGFRLADLVALRAQFVINTHWHAGSDVPLAVNGQLIAWCEFEAVEKRLAVRLTRLV